jgi:hypothetical protein
MTSRAMSYDDVSDGLVRELTTWLLRPFMGPMQDKKKFVLCQLNKAFMLSNSCSANSQSDCPKRTSSRFSPHAHYNFFTGMVTSNG